MIPKIDDITGIPTFITSDFDEPILYTPARTEFSQPCSSLKIITAFTDCDRISTHMIKLSEGMKNRQMLELYGKTYVTFRKYEDGTYLLDF